MTTETDFRSAFPVPEVPSYLPGTRIEPLRRRPATGFPRTALFDFDGTLSLIREGWPEVMIPLMVAHLQRTGTDETSAHLTSLVANFVHELTGKQTIYQMIRLAEEVRRRGGSPEDPVDYKRQYHDALSARIESRRAALRSGQDSPEAWLVPGSRDLLEGLFVRGVELYLASGTDLEFVREEAELLGIAHFFGPRIYAALPQVDAFSKEMVIRSILADTSTRPTDLIGFGDGYVEIDNLASYGALAIGVASDESRRGGAIDPWKRNRLIGVGAHLIVADYQERDELFARLFRGEW